MIQEERGRKRQSSSSCSSTTDEETQSSHSENSVYSTGREQQTGQTSTIKTNTTTNLRHNNTLRFETNSRVSVENSPDEQGRTSLPVVPGLSSYSGALRGSSAPPAVAVGVSENSYSMEERRSKISAIKARRAAREKETMIFSSSVTRDINKFQFNNACLSSKVRFHEFKGKKIEDIVKYMRPHLEESPPSSVMFVAGGNDLTNQQLSPEKLRAVADILINGGKTCKREYGVEQVYISSILPRSHSKFQGNRHRLNELLKDLCHENGFIFVDHSNIVLRPHGHHDGVHLNEAGSSMLRANLLNALKN